MSINIDLGNSNLSAADNGNGMSPEQFHYFLTIAARMRFPRRSPRYQRERIGQFGVGFLAAFPFCEEMIVETSAVGSPTVITATIPCANYMKERAQGTDPTVELLEEIRVPVTELSDPRKINVHYTKIVLSGLTPLAQEYFDDTSGTQSKSALRASPPIERLRWDLQDTIVLDYPPESIVAASIGQKAIGMEVYLDGRRLYRNEPPGEILETHVTEGRIDGVVVGNLRVRYAITSPWKPVHPVEMRGLRIRVNNVGVGPRQTFGLAVQAGALPRFYWLSGDVYIDEGGRDYLAINREGFTNATSIDALNAYFQSALRRVETRLSAADTRLKEVETELGVKVRGGGPRLKLPVGSKRDFVDSRFRELEEMGFTVERHRASDIGQNSKPLSSRGPAKVNRAPSTTSRLLHDPVEIDRESKVIRVYDEHPDFEDTLVTALGKFTLEYDAWDYATAIYPACELRQPNIMRVNTSYPLFKSKAYGRLFLRIAVTLTVFMRRSPDLQKITRDLLLKWVEEFGDLID